jgi:hypothetical protein
MFVGKVKNLAVAALIGLPMIAGAATQAVEVYKTANPSDTREKMGIPDRLGSCHTAVIGGYAIEGHVPAADIKRLLAAQPKARGLAVPAMPAGSPGMEGPTQTAYDVLLVGNDGSTTVYKHYE